MLADRTLLAVTLAATFAAGGTAGWAARDRRADAPLVPTSAEQAYAPQLRRLREKGFDEAEMREAVRLHQAYLDEWRLWWNRFAKDHEANLDLVDRRFQTDLASLEARVRARREAAGGGR